jgi:hypothetical protein
MGIPKRACCGFFLDRKRPSMPDPLYTYRENALSLS